MFLVVLLCTVFHGGDAIAPVVALPHFGAVFTSRGFYNNHFSYWSTTIAIPLPNLTLPTHALTNFTCYQGINVQHFCETYEPLFSYVNNETAHYITLLKNHQTTINALTSTIQDSRRSKRGLLDVVGEIGKSLFGLSTVHDARILSQHILKIEEVLNGFSSNDMFKAKHINSFMIETNKRLDGISDALMTNHALIRNLSTSFHVLMQSSFQMNVQLERLQVRLNEFIKFLPVVLQKLNVQITMLAELEKQTVSFIKSLELLHTGVLSTDLVSTSTLQLLINNISTALLHSYPEVQVAYQDISQYYKMSKIHAVSKNGILYIYLQIPLRSVDSLFHLYRSQIYPIPVGQHHVNVTHKNAMTKITNVARYIAVSDDKNYFIELSDSDLASCTGNEFLECANPKALVRSEQHTCTSALFFNLTDQALSLCDILYSDNAVFDPIMTYLTKGEILVISNPMDLTMTCFSKPPYIISHSGFAKIKIPCGCTLSSKTLVVPTSYNDCSFGNTLISHVYPTNVLYLRLLLTNESSSISCETLNNKQYVFNLPQITLASANLSSFAAKDQQFSADLKKSIALFKSDKPAFVRPSDKLFSLAADSTFSQFSSVSLPSILTILNLFMNCISLIILFFVIYKYKVLSAVIFLDKARATPLDDIEIELKQFEHDILFLVIPCCLILTTFICALIYLIINKCRKNCSLTPYFGYRSHTNLLLDFSTLKYHITVKVASFPYPPACLRATSREKITLGPVQRGWFSGTVEVDWNDLHVELHGHSKRVKLPTILKLNYFQCKALFAMQNRDMNGYRNRVLIGNNNYFSQIPLSNEAIVALEHVYLTPNPQGPQSIEI